MEDSPVLTALTHTPRWVFMVFVGLLFLGYQQSRNRTVTRPALVLLPATMLGFSLYGVASSFGFSVLPFLAWAVGVAITYLLGRRLLQSPAYPDPSGSFQVSGSWWPLAVMMGIFFVKYVTSYALARNLPFALQPSFVGCISLALGLLSGIFVARAVTIWHSDSKVRGYA
jgi:hypothetical protein